jgi:hypothetical protein
MATNAAGQNGDRIVVGDITDGRAIAIGRGATAIYQGLSVEEVAVLVAELKRADQPIVWDGRIPYLGLSAFQESDAAFFFGRESVVDDLLQRVQAANFIVIAGPSGSGKSSVARAGLFHRLRDGCLPKSHSWLLATIYPGGNPLEQLALALERLTHVPGTGNHIRRHGLENSLALQEQIQTLLSDDPGHRFVLLVDQFEDSFTQTKEEAARVAFINLLTCAAQSAGGRTIILLALRSDFVYHCARYPELRELMSRQFQLVGAMEAHDLAKAITLPALEVGAVIDIVYALSAPGARLLTSSGGQDEKEFTETTVTIAHERLIEAWPWLNNLGVEEGELLALQNRVTNYAREWQRRSEDPRYLYAAGPLSQVEERLDELQSSLDDLSWRFVKASIVEQERRQASEEKQRRDEAELQIQQEIDKQVQASQLGLASKAENDPETSVLLALAAVGTNLQADTHFQLSQRLETSYRATLRGHEDWVWSAVFSPDGHTILTVGSDGTARLWNRQGEELAVWRRHQTMPNGT